ncbi:MAG: hypothetical protein V8S32_11205, partial [Lachnospiraceae bacterium]
CPLLVPLRVYKRHFRPDGESLTLPAPPLHCGKEPGEVQQYSECDVRIEAPGYAPLTVNGSNVFSGRQTI